MHIFVNLHVIYFSHLIVCWAITAVYRHQVSWTTSSLYGVSLVIELMTVTVQHSLQRIYNLSCASLGFIVLCLNLIAFLYWLSVLVCVMFMSMNISWKKSWISCTLGRWHNNHSTCSSLTYSQNCSKLRGTAWFSVLYLDAFLDAYVADKNTSSLKLLLFVHSWQSELVMHHHDYQDAPQTILGLL